MIWWPWLLLSFGGGIAVGWLAALLCLIAALSGCTTIEIVAACDMHQASGSAPCVSGTITATPSYTTTIPMMAIP